MNGPLTWPRDSFKGTARDVILSLAVMNSSVFLWQRGRIADECGCGKGGAVAVEVATAVVLAGFLLWLIGLAIRYWPPRIGWTLLRLAREQARHFWAAIVPWLMTVLGIVLLAVPSQTADMLAGIQGRTPLEVGWPIVPFAVGAAAWCLATWFCGRWTIDIERRISLHGETWLTIWNPRAMALLTGFAIIIVTGKAAALCSGAMIVADACAGLVITFTVARRPLIRRFHPTWRSGGRARLALAARPNKGPVARFMDDLRVAPGGPPLVAFVLGLSVIVILWFAFGAQSSGRILHAPGIALLGLACLTMIATFVSKAGLRILRVPLILTGFIITTILSHWNLGVDHSVRTMEHASAIPPPAGTLRQAAEIWLRTCGKSLADEQRGPAPKVIKAVLVSAAGGASRAAFWTLDTLFDLQLGPPGSGPHAATDYDRRFPRRVFAISAVSGGALGAAIWSALLAHDDFDCTKPIAPDDPHAARRRLWGQAMLRQDFLAPVLATLLSRDVILGVVPVSWIARLFHQQIDDRSAALEQAWEASWPADAGANLFAGDFMTLWGSKMDRPLLLLNGTVEDTGQPIVTAPVPIVAPDTGAPLPDLPATYDARALLRNAIRTSTAVLNAARFPLVTSQGDIGVVRCEDGTHPPSGTCPDEKHPGMDTISVVDGGYFDNIGAGTTIRAANALREAFQAFQADNPGYALRIMVVGVNSDPDRFISAGIRKFLDQGKPTTHPPVDQVMRCGASTSSLNIGEKGLDNTLDDEIAPFLAIVQTQSGHTAMRMAELNEQFCSVHGTSAANAPPPDPKAPNNYVMLSLCPTRNDMRSVPLPLNWVLSKPTLDLFTGADGQWTVENQCGNGGEFGAYHSWVAAD